MTSITYNIELHPQKDVKISVETESTFQFQPLFCFKNQ